MNKSGLAVLTLAIGLVVGLLLGYAFFDASTPASTAATSMSSGDTDQTAAPDSQHYYYHMNDSMISRHTVGGSGDAIYHRIDTIAVQRSLTQ